MKAVRVRSRKIVLSVEALVHFFREFDPSMIDALVELCDLGAAHPDYDDDLPGTSQWLEADIATDLLSELFTGTADRPIDIDEAPRVTVDGPRGTITIHLPRRRKPRASAPSMDEEENPPPPDVPPAPLAPPPIDVRPDGDIPRNRAVWRKPRRWEPPG